MRVTTDRIASVAVRLGLTLAVAATSLPGLSAHAGVDPPTKDFYMSVSPSARLLDSIFDPDYYDVKYEEQCDNPHLRVRSRNTPAIRIDNFSDASTLTSFTLQINEGPYIFGSGDSSSANFVNFIKPSVYSSSGVVITGSSLSPDKKKLTVNFNGLVPDANAIFMVDLDLDPNDPASDGYFNYPDYRNVLFGAPIDTGEDPTAPASVTATFGPPDPRVLEGTLQQLTEAPSYQNDLIRPYGLADPVEVLTFQIPEPASVVPALVAAGVGLISARRARRLRHRG